MGASTEKKINDIKGVIKLGSELGRAGFKTEKAELREVARKKAHSLVKSLKPRKSRRTGASPSSKGKSTTLNFY